MHILVTNDDGVRSEGILALADALRPLGDVTIVAPLNEASAIGHALTTRPDVFDGYISISPSTWWNQQALVAQLPAFLAKHRDLRASLYMTTGNEGGEMLTSAQREAVPPAPRTTSKGIGPGDIGVVVVTHASASTIDICLFRLLTARDVSRVVGGAT